MSDTQRVALILIGVGGVLIIARVANIAHGSQVFIGLAFMAAGVAIYLGAGRSH
ncbi:MAG: hypothetical protein JWN72_1186 [Thermoleophilia bacterium]|nr:hypothetical protein [Thermoleophilia bacterium]